MSPTCDDDLGTPVAVPDRITRVVSIVPSLTESIAATAPGLLIGATDWCTHPPNLDVRRVRGTKNPDVDAILELAPDIVIANQEENRRVEIEQLRAAGVPVWVTAPTTVAESLDSLERMLTLACRLEVPEWLREARAAWPATPPAPTRTAVIPIWRRPWMAIGHGTFTGDLLRQLGIANALDSSPERYPKLDLEDVRGRVDLVILPDEPYVFSSDDGPEAFADWDVTVACVSGRHLTWYGPSLVEARAILQTQLLL